MKSDMNVDLSKARTSYKMNSEWVPDQNVYRGTTKLRKYIGENVSDLGLGKEFLDLNQKHDPEKEK